MILNVFHLVRCDTALMLGFSRQIAGPEAGEVLAKRSGGRGIARQIQQGDGYFRGTVLSVGVRLAQMIGRDASQIDGDYR